MIRRRIFLNDAILAKHMGEPEKEMLYLVLLMSPHSLINDLIHLHLKQSEIVGIFNKRTTQGWVMHEMSIAMNIVDIAVETARQNGARKINSITIEVGALSGVVPEALEFCFEAATRETMAEGSHLEIIYLKAQAECPHCGLKFETDQFLNVCPDCGEQVLASGGKQLQVKNINVD